MATQISVMTVPVSDQEAAKRFYTDVLDFDVLQDNSFGQDGHVMRWVMLRPSGGGTAITLATWFDSLPAGSLTGSILAVDDLDEAIARYTSRGLKLLNDGRVESAPWGRWVAFEDLDGNGWLLQQNSPLPG